MSTATAVGAPPAAVLWDMDGTLVDTEPYWMAAELELVREFGGRWTEADARSIIGFDLLDAAAVLRDRGGVRLEPTEIVERLHAGVLARIRERMPWRPGARRLLTELHQQGVPCALVTMSWRPLVDAVLEALAPIRFEAVVTGDAVTNGKPHPEPYVRAAAELGVDPVQCVAIEDSPTGVDVGSRGRVRRRRRAEPRRDRTGRRAVHHSVAARRDARAPRRDGRRGAAADHVQAPVSSPRLRHGGEERRWRTGPDRHRSRAGRARAGRHRRVRW